MSVCGENVGSDEQVLTCSRVEDGSLKLNSTERLQGNMEVEEYIEGTNTPKGAEKRRRPISDAIEDDLDDGFTTVCTRRAKRLAKRNSKYSDSHTSQNNTNSEETYEVSITSKDILPKQIAFAKLLRSENVTNILKIKFRSPFKALIWFGCRENAEKLLQNKKLSDMGFRMKLADETGVSYGVIKDIDLDEEEKELLENLQCDQEILTVRRLKRLEEGKWIDCETVRISFKSPTLPPYVYGFGCRFEVKPYTFPVTQCGKCWRFGHPTRYCPMSKVVCPKCCLGHDNCETTEYKCVNCKNHHMANDKTCPVYLKEKYIRTIMQMENCTYRRALEIYRDSKKSNEEKDYSDTDCESTYQNYYSTARAAEPLKKTYRDILLTEAIVHSERSDTDDIINEESLKTNKMVRLQSKKKKKIQPRAEIFSEDWVVQSTQHNKEQSEQNTENQEPTKPNLYEGKITLMLFIKKMKEILMSNSKLEEKIVAVVEFFYEIISKLVLAYFEKIEVLKNFVSFFKSV